MFGQPNGGIRDGEGHGAIQLKMAGLPVSCKMGNSETVLWPMMAGKEANSFDHTLVCYLYA